MQDAASTVLVIEDDESLRFVLEAGLGIWGYRAISAADGAIALKLVQQVSPHLILVDLSMPVMDGASSHGLTMRRQGRMRQSSCSPADLTAPRPRAKSARRRTSTSH